MCQGMYIPICEDEDSDSHAEWLGGVKNKAQGKGMKQCAGNRRLILREKNDEDHDDNKQQQKRAAKITRKREFPSRADGKGAGR